MACLPFLICLLLISFCKCDDQLTQAKQLHPGDVLGSKSGVFALGFFSPGTSNKSLYLGIWYHNIPQRTYVWVANRDNPISTPSSSVMLAISNSSNLVLSDSEGRTLWTTNITITGGDGAYAALLDTGNLVLQLPNETIIWQSFDHPTDTILPNMKFLLRYKAQVSRRLVAWKGPNDPSTGEFSLSGDPSLDIQAFIWHGTKPYYRFVVIGSVSVSGEAYGSNTTSFIYQTLVNTQDEFYVRYTTSDGSANARIMLDYMGTFRFLSWDDSSSSWTVRLQRPASTIDCYTYASCGPFGYCDAMLAIPRCQCLDGFEPDTTNSSRGCRRKQQLRCGDGNHFVTMSGMKVPDKFIPVPNRSFDECTAECNRNCSCTAYAYANLTIAGTTADQSRCLLWTGELVDTGRTGFGDGQNLYLRLAYSPGYTSEANKKNKKVVKVVVPIIACLLTFTSIYLVRKWQTKGKQRNDENKKRTVLGNFTTSHELFEQKVEFPNINFEEVATATNNFSDSNMLGKGGFGKVYKGKLEGGKEVAVKRLGTGSTQGVEHFTNEVVLIAKLQHKNLVRLLGCCIHGEEKLLIYEYLPNRSLDYFLFDDSKKSMLDWRTRFNIIKGVARGLVYLHQDSRMTIIHRDLKASNILLDEEMSPKISDFGMARIFGSNQHQANTKHVVGTYGYMSPEYAMEGIFSVKSDTYSFGVLVLELISGSKISSPHLTMDFPNLIARAWSLWKDGNAEDFVDSIILESYAISEFLLCIHLGLLCVQEDPSARPFMSSVVAMLENETTARPTPKQPAYFVPRNYMAEGTRQDANKSVNSMSLTTLQGR
ncbi:Os04g0633800 [Oryza sativa Japonica Group]|nr:Os04g0633800 [Oryza sativa Japonica Group]